MTVYTSSRAIANLFLCPPDIRLALEKRKDYGIAGVWTSPCIPALSKAQVVQHLSNHQVFLPLQHPFSKLKGI